MFKLFAFSVVISFTATLSAKTVEPEKVKKWEERKKFVAKESTEAKVVFTQTVELDPAEDVDDYGKVRPHKKDVKPNKERQLMQVEEQVWHLFGPLSAEDSMYAAPKNDHKLKINSVTRKPDVEEEIYLINYTYTGTMQVKNGPKSKFLITLPVNPDKIYGDSKVGRRYPCTDHHYQDKSDFWYFWNPENTGCKLKAEKDYVTFIPTTLDRTPITKNTYPDYPRMPNKDNVIQLSLLMGMDEASEEPKQRNPMTSRDINAKTYRALRKELIEMGFTAPETPWTRAEVKEVVPVSDSRLGTTPYVETLTKVGKRLVKGKPVSIEITMFFGPSGINEDSRVAFHYFFKQALEQHTATFYDGHSGLGGHLDLDSIESEINDTINFPESKYQLYFFNSCTSYTYYNAMFFERKGGIDNLDILVNGLATAFDVLQDTNMAVIKGIDLWANGRKGLKFLDLASTIDSSNLFSVNGDETNPTSIED